MDDPEHTVTERRTFREDVLDWSGFLTCSCGWRTEVTHRPSREIAEVGLQAAWIEHSD